MNKLGATTLHSHKPACPFFHCSSEHMWSKDQGLAAVACLFMLDSTEVAPISP